MRHFAHHIGDYAAATAHLSFVEDAAYHRLLRRYYQDEKPLPADVAQVQRLVGARTKEEKDAVNAVLPEFFTLGPGGWHQPRADRELAAYHNRAASARENGNRGGRPTKTETEPKENPVGFQTGAEQETEPIQQKKLTNNHKPVTNNQEPILEKNSTASAAPSDDELEIPEYLKGSSKRGTRLPDDWQLAPELRAFASDLGLDPDVTRDEFVDFWRGIPGARGKKLDWPATFRNRCRELGRKPTGHHRGETFEQRRIREAREAVRNA